MIELQPTITYPNCGHQKIETMATDIASIVTSVKFTGHYSSQNKEIVESFALMAMYRVRRFKNLVNQK